MQPTLDKQLVTLLDLKDKESFNMQVKMLREKESDWSQTLLQGQNRSSALQSSKEKKYDPRITDPAKLSFCIKTSILEHAMKLGILAPVILHKMHSEAIAKENET